MPKRSEHLDRRLAHVRRTNWKIFFLGYLDAARKCAQSYLQYTKNTSTNGSNYAEFVFVPAFWNLKHAIELALKFIVVEKEMAPQRVKDIKISKTHDIRFLIHGLIRQKKIKSNEAAELIEICEKYASLKPLAKMLESKKDVFFKASYPALHDPKNMFFKYPEGDEAHSGFEYHIYTDLFINGVDSQEKEKVMQDAMKELQDDSRRLSTLCGRVFNS